MSQHRHFVLLALVLSLGTSGCSWFKRKKPNVVPQAQAPPATEPHAGAPPATATLPPPPAQEPKAAEPAAATAKKPRPKPAYPVKKVVVPPPKPEDQTTTVAASSSPPRVAIQESAPTNQISPAMPHDQATDSKRTTQQLLDSTDANLRGLQRALTADEKSMVEQIRAYQQQARSAGQEGDLVRAHNLALKAHLLSDELVKR